MPSVNIYTSKDKVDSLKPILPTLREAIAKALLCKDRKLAKDEISLRVLVPETALQIADTELEIIAYQYEDRINNQDDICLSIQSYMQQQCPQAGSVYVWLKLSELGHSLKESQRSK